MGYQDRDYYKRSPGSGAFGSLPAWSYTIWLIAINVAIYVLDSLSGPERKLSQLGYFSAATAIGSLEIWRFITFQFLHASPSHLIFNMLSLYFFGPMVEEYLGSRRFLVFYLLCGVAGAAMYMLLLLVGLLHDGAYTPLVGASAGIFGVLIAAARIAPDTTVMLLLFPIPMRLKTMAWGTLAIAVYTVVVNGNNAGGEAAHLGGAALGYLLIAQPQILKALTTWPGQRPPRGRGYKMDDWR